MTYDYDEFMSQFAGADKLPEYACGGKTKVKKACGGKKIAVGQNGNKVKKNIKSSVDDDANDNAAINPTTGGKPGDKVDPWMLPQNKQSQQPPVSPAAQKFKDAKKGIIAKSKKLQPRK